MPLPQPQAKTTPQHSDDMLGTPKKTDLTPQTPPPITPQQPKEALTIGEGTHALASTPNNTPFKRPLFHLSPTKSSENTLETLPTNESSLFGEISVIEDSINQPRIKKAPPALESGRENTSIASPNHDSSLFGGISIAEVEVTFGDFSMAEDEVPKKSSSALEFGEKTPP